MLELHGEVDIATALTMTARLDEVTAVREPQLVLDLGHVTFLDASGLTMLCRAHRRVQERSGSLRVVCAHALILRLLRITGLDERLRPVRTLKEALVEPSGAPPREQPPEAPSAHGGTTS